MAKINYRKIPGKIIASASLIALLGTGAATLTLNEIARYEGYVPEAYRDIAGIPTICFGDTHNVRFGYEATFQECTRRLNTQVEKHARPILKCIPSLKDQPDQVKVAFVSMAYNIGTNAFCKSPVAKLARDGHYEAACQRMAKSYIYATDKKTGKKVQVTGLVNRRKQEASLCLQGLHK